MVPVPASDDLSFAMMISIKINLSFAMMMA